MAKRATRNVSFLAERADRISRNLYSDTVTMMSVFLRDPEWYASTIVTNDDDPLPDGGINAVLAARLTDAEQTYLQRISDLTRATPGEDLIALTRWARTRVCYVIDPDTARAVQQTDWDTTVIPGDVLRRLPHPNPLVVLPEPVRLPSYADDGATVVGIEEYVAFLILGAKPPRRRCSTTDPDCDRYVLHFLGYVLDPVTGKPEITSGPAYDGGVRNVKSVLGMRALVSLDDATMADRQEFAVRDVLSLGWASRVGFKDDDHAAQATRDLVALGLALTVFLVTDDLDTTTSTVTPRRKGSSPKKPTRAATGDTDATTVVEVGYRLGAALRNAGHGHDSGRGSGDGKRTVRPHLRRAHLHRFWKGPRKEPASRYQVLHWIPPTPVAYKDDELPDTTQIHFP